MNKGGMKEALGCLGVLNWAKLETMAVVCVRLCVCVRVREWRGRVVVVKKQ